MNALKYLEPLIEFESTSCFSNVAISDHVADRLQELGFETERVEYQDHTGVRKVNILGRRGPGSGGMAYFAHTDVVPADPWFSDTGPFTPVVEGDRVYGRGSCDMKGSIACMLAAAERVAANTQKQPVYVVCTADEEVGYLGARQVVERSRTYREIVDGDARGIIGEPTMLEVVHAHKGSYGFDAIAQGRAAHSSTSEGINANLAMIPFLQEMKLIHDETMSDSAWQDARFDPPILSWNIGINDHTHAINITPPQSVCTVYFRPMPGQDPELLINRARDSANECGVELRIRYRGEPMYTDPDSHFVQESLALAGRSAPRTVCYGTDGGTFTELKQKIVFGPGDIAQAHTEDEWVSLEQLESGTNAFERLIREWCC